MGKNPGLAAQDGPAGRRRRRLSVVLGIFRADDQRNQHHLVLHHVMRELARTTLKGALELFETLRLALESREIHPQVSVMSRQE